MTQEQVELHSATVDQVVSEFSGRVSSSVDEVVGKVSSWLLDNLSVKSGRVSANPENSAKLIEVVAAVRRAITESDYYPAAVDFVSSFHEQVDHFSDLYSSMGSELPTVILSEEDHDVLADQAAAALIVLEAEVARVLVNLKTVLSRSIGGVAIGELTGVVSEVIRRLNRVEPIARDQLLLFFRVVANLAYTNIERSGKQLLYKYVGPRSEESRDFCKACSTRSNDPGSFTREDIAALDNRQVPDVMCAGGGYGCRHWWAIAA